MFTSRLIDRILSDRTLEPLAVLGGYDDVAMGPEQIAKTRDAAIEAVAEVKAFFELYGDLLQTPTLEKFVRFTAICNMDDSKEYLQDVVKFFDSQDLRLYGLAGVTLGEFEVSQLFDAADTTFQREQCGMGVTAIAAQKNCARSTVYAKLEEFQRWPAELKDTLLQFVRLVRGEPFAQEPADVACQAR